MTFIDTLRYESGDFVDLPRHLERIRATALAHGGHIGIDRVEQALYLSAPESLELFRVTLYYDKE